MTLVSEHFGEDHVQVMYLMTLSFRPQENAAHILFVARYEMIKYIGYDCWPIVHRVKYIH